MQFTIKNENYNNNKRKRDLNKQPRIIINNSSVKHNHKNNNKNNFQHKKRNLPKNSFNDRPRIFSIDNKKPTESFTVSLGNRHDGERKVMHSNFQNSENHSPSQNLQFTIQNPLPQSNHFKSSHIPNENRINFFILFFYFHFYFIF